MSELLDAKDAYDISIRNQPEVIPIKTRSDKWLVAIMDKIKEYCNYGQFEANVLMMDEDGKLIAYVMNELSGIGYKVQAIQSGIHCGINIKWQIYE